MPKSSRGIGSFVGLSRTKGSDGGVFRQQEQFLLQSNNAWRPDVISSGLVLNLNAANTLSYPGTGTTWFDLSDSKLNATGSSAITNRALAWNQPYTTATTSILNTDVHSLFFSIQINGTTGTWDKIFGYTPSGTDRSPGIWRYPSFKKIHWRYDPNNSDADFSSDASTTYETAGTEFANNTWYYVGVVKNGATASTYVNGVKLADRSVSNPKSGGTSTIQLFPSYSGSTAYIRHVHIYNRALSSAEVLINYTNTRIDLV